MASALLHAVLAPPLSLVFFRIFCGIEKARLHMTNSCPPPLQTSPYQSLSLHLKQLHLSHMLTHWETLEAQAMQESWSYAQFLLALCELEAQRRWSARLQRALSQAQLPNAKTLSNFDFSCCPKFNPAPLMQVADDSTWLTRAENLLLFGSSGVGKTHLAVAVAHRMVELANASSSSQPSPWCNTCSTQNCNCNCNRSSKSSFAKHLPEG